jgi:hypothetical protein
MGSILLVTGDGELVVVVVVDAGRTAPTAAVVVVVIRSKECLFAPNITFSSLLMNPS